MTLEKLAALLEPDPDTRDLVLRVLQLAVEASDQLVFVSNMRQITLSAELKRALNGLGCDVGPLTHLVSDVELAVGRENRAGNASK